MQIGEKGGVGEHSCLGLGLVHFEFKFKERSNKQIHKIACAKLYPFIESVHIWHCDVFFI